MRRSFLSLITVTALALVLAPSARAQGTVGTVSGTIRERGSERALSGVQVRVVGTQRGAITDATGGWEAVFFVGCGLNAAAALMAWFVLKPMRSKFMETAVTPASSSFGRTPVWPSRIR